MVFQIYNVRQVIDVERRRVRRIKTVPVLSIKKQIKISNFDDSSFSRTNNRIHRYLVLKKRLNSNGQTNRSKGVIRNCMINACKSDFIELDKYKDIEAKHINNQAKSTLGNTGFGFPTTKRQDSRHFLKRMLESYFNAKK